ncbi:MAG: glycoside hydrolase family 16 protein [Candidatus Aminicenantales bacterium]
MAGHFRGSRHPGILSVLVVLAVQAAACAIAGSSPKMKLIWSEEFNVDGLPDPANWGYETGRIRNQEAQVYTAGRPENARVEGGCLVIESRKEDYAGAAYTSASVNTLGRREFSYGRIEVRAKIPTGVGSWPAIWMMGTDIPSAGWPECGEIDIMENVGYQPDTIYATVHTPGSVHDPGRVIKGGQISVSAPYADFHVYAVEWRSDRLDFFVDDHKYFTYSKDSRYPDYWRFAKPFYILLNTAIGGTWGGEQGIDDSIFPLKYSIDYVRYYQWE